MIFYPPTNRGLYSPKESALALSVWVPLVRVLSFPCFIGYDFLPPTNRGLYLVGWGGVAGWVGLGWGGAYFWVKIDFFKVILDLFRKCLGFVFGLKRPTSGCILSSKGR